MKKSKFIIGLFACFAFMSLASCSDSEKETNAPAESEIYSIDIVLQSEAGAEEEQVMSRGVSPAQGKFTTSYDFNYIYLHKINSDNTEITQSVSIPLGDDCNPSEKCFNIQVEDESGNYTIKVGENTIQLSSNETVVFSNLDSATWEATTGTNNGPSAIKDATILTQPTDTTAIKNNEILRSYNYTGQQLISLINLSGVPGTDSSIKLQRHVSAYKLGVVFTESSSSGDTSHSMTKAEFLNKLGISENDFSNLEIKLYFGPYFAESYNMITGATDSDDNYYCTTEDYVKFDEVTLYSGGFDTGHTHTGCGIRSDVSLVTPLQRRLLDGQDQLTFDIYICVKYNGKQYYWKEDLTRTTTNVMNRSNATILTYSAEDLMPIIKGTVGNTAEASEQSRSAWSSSEMQELDIKPIEVIYQ